MSFPGYKKLESWRVCRIDPVFHLNPEKRQYGHWWIEISEDESYGFWPYGPVSGLRDTLFGVKGEVNAPAFCPSPTEDLHHGDTTKNSKSLREFDVWAPDDTDEHDLANAVRSFAGQFRARWAWPATPLTGENCHSFQDKLLRQFNLRITAR